MSLFPIADLRKGRNWYVMRFTLLLLLLHRNSAGMESIKMGSMRVALIAGQKFQCVCIDTV